MNSIPGELVRRLLYTHNPFYLISAGLVLRGAPELFAPGDDSWSLLGLLAGYAALLAVAGVLVIRLGRVWDDARSILLVLLLLFVAISASFDPEVIARFQAGTGALLYAFAFCAGCTEAVLRAARIRLPWAYRAPLHALLAVFFAYPVLLAALLRTPEPAARAAALALGTASFPAVAAAISLALIPAIRRGRAGPDPSGTPWRWPWFPWTPFVILAVGVAGRSYWLTLSFYPGGGATPPFGLYFLAPIALAAGVLLLEAGLVSGARGTLRAALAAPGVAALLALHLGPAGAARVEILEAIGAAIGSPPVATLWAAAAFYGLALARGVRAAEAGIAASLLLASIAAARPEPLAVLAAAAIVQAVREPRTWRVVAAHLASVLALSTAAGIGASPALHLAGAGALAAAFWFDDDLARLIRRAGGYAAAAAFAAALLRDPVPRTYAAAAFALPPAVWLLTREPHWFRALLLECGALAVFVAGATHGLLGGSGRPGAVLLFWGALSFVVAALTSAAKAGGLAPIYARIAALAGLKRRAEPEPDR